MASAELPPTNQTPDESGASPAQSHTQMKWVLTREALDKLLQCFSPNREEAGRLYELTRLKVMRVFECRSCHSPEDLVDEVINRVARRIDEGEIIFNLNGYFLRVARLIFMESLREQSRTSVSLDEIPEPPLVSPCDDEEKEARLSCLDLCLEKLTIQNRTLILKYYQDEKRAKIDHRKQLAETFGIPLNALRIRAHRIRSFLEKCVEGCLTPAGLSRNKTGFSTL